MTSLHKVSESIKKLGKFITFLAIGVIIFLILLNIGKSFKEHFYPTPPPAPTVSFGKLPSTDFPSSNFTNDYSYSLNTLTGQLPNFPPQLAVYKIIVPSPNILASQNTKEKVSKIGFLGEPIPLSDSIYRWFDSKPPVRTIDVNIFSLNFNLFSNYKFDQIILSGNKLPSENDAIDTANKFLSSLFSLPPDLDINKTKTALFSIVNGKLVSATSLSSAQVVRVDYFQGKINNLAINYPNPPFSVMNVFVGGGKFEPQVVEANFFHQNISQVLATYPLKTSSEAFSELKKGGAYIASSYGNEKNIVIKEVSLGYFLGNKPQNYLMPIFVFKADNGFFAYISAVRDEWINK